MDGRDLVDYLVRVALDADFRTLALADPDASFAGYDLSEDDRAVLRRGDADVLALVGRAVRSQLGVDPPPPSKAEDEVEPAAEADGEQSPAAARPPGHPLPEMAVMVRLAPFAEGIAGADLQVSYVASLQPVPHPALVDAVQLEPAPAPGSAVFDDVRTDEGDAAEITVVGLGMAAADHLTREVERAIRGANEVLYLDTGVATPALLEELSSHVTSLYVESYAEDGARLAAYDHMAERVVEAAVDHAPVVFAIHGHPLVAVHPPFRVAELAGERGLGVQVLPGISALDCLFADLGIDPVVDGIQMYEATDLLLRMRPLHPDVPLVIWQAGNVESRLHTSRRSRPERFTRLTSHLLRFYPAGHPATIYFASPHPLVPVARDQVSLRELPDHALDLHAGVTLYVPPAFHRPLVDAELLALVDDPAHLRRLTR